MKRIIAFLPALLFMLPAYTQVLTETFGAYTAGSSLTGQGGWTQCASGTTQLKVNGNNLSYPSWLTGSNTLNSVYFNSGMNNLGGYCKTFNPIGTTSVYMAFLFRDSVIAPQANTGDYFITIGSGWLNNAARVLFKSSGGAYYFGVRKTGGADAWSTVSYAPNQTHLVVLKYKFVSMTNSDDEVGIYVDPPLPGGEPAFFTVTAPATTDFTGAISNLFLRLNMSALNMPDAYVDAINVDSTWARVTGGAGACNGVASFSFSQSGSTVNVTNTSTGNYATAKFSFGDGGQSTQGTASHTYSNPGIYTLCLTLLDNLGQYCDSACITVNIPNPNCSAQAAFTATQSGMQFQFTNASTGSYGSLLYDFGDGFTSAQGSLSHTYTVPGAYTACLTLFDATGGFCDSFCTVLNPSVQPCNATAVFSHTLNGSTLSCTNQSTGSYASLKWSFGDGSVSTQTNPAHVYVNAGTYAVCLTLLDSAGLFCDSTCVTVSVQGGGSICAAQAAFTSSGNSLNWNFTNSSIGNYGSLLYEFGDGGTSNQNNPAHHYPGPAQYLVCLSLFDSAANFCDSACQYVNPAASPCNAVAAFTSGATGLNATFTNTSTGGYGSLSWSFGDGGSSTQPNPSHLYTTPGSYTVCLTLNDSLGSFCDSICNTITVSAPPCNASASFTFSITGSTVNFTNTSTGAYSTQKYNFGDGAISSSGNTSHAYSAPGTYLVCLTLSGNGGVFCDSACATITIGSPPCNANAAFTYSLNGLTASFNNTSTGTWGLLKYAFGDGAISNSPIPSHTYSAPGTYLACLTLQDSAGAFCDSACTTLIVTAPPCNAQASFTSVPVGGGGTVNFTNTSVGNYSSLLYEFGDGATSTQNNPSHTYSSAGAYGVCLTLQDTSGFCDSSCSTVNVVITGLQAMMHAGLRAVAGPDGRISLWSDHAFEADVELTDVKRQFLVRLYSGQLTAGWNVMRLVPEPAAGLYLLRVSSGGASLHLKLILGMR